MHDLDLARLIHADREREIARDLRAHAARRAKADLDAETFVPEPSARPGRLTHALRFTPEPRRGS